MKRSARVGRHVLDCLTNEHSRPLSCRDARPTGRPVACPGVPSTIGGILVPKPRRTAAIALATLLIFAMAMPVLAKSAPKPPTLKVSAVVSGSSVTLNYQVNVAASQIAAQSCQVSDGFLTFELFCDSTPNKGSGAKQTKYSITPPLSPNDYTFFVDLTLTGGSHVANSTGFVIAGPAVRFEVTGLVEQPSVCVAGPDCVNFPAPDYPRQIAKITALDANDNVATGYAGTVSFEHPLGHTPSGLSNTTLTNGVGFVSVLVPDLWFGGSEEPYATHCPSGPSGTGVVLTATDTVNPSIFGCQNIPGGFLSIIFPDGFADTTTPLCPSGCVTDPTDSIVIDPSFFGPRLITPTVTSGSSATVAVGTSTDLYATTTLNLSNLVVVGDLLAPGALSACINCSTSESYFVGSIEPVANSAAQLTSTTISFEGTVPPGVNDSYWMDFGSIPVTSVVTGGSTPTCYQDSALSFTLSLSACGEDPLAP